MMVLTGGIKGEHNIQIYAVLSSIGSCGGGRFATEWSRGADRIVR